MKASFWLECFKEAYDRRPLPKHHYMFHFEEYVAEDNMLPGGFPTGRRHKLYKGYGDTQYQQRNFERSVVLGMLGQHVREIETEGWGERGNILYKSWKADDVARALGVSSARAAKLASSGGTRTATHDMVFVDVLGAGITVAQVLLHVHTMPALSGCDTGFCTLVQLWRQVAADAWARTNDQILVSLGSIVAAATWKGSATERIVIAPPIISGMREASREHH